MTKRQDSDARDRNNPISANQIRLQTSLINQEHRPIRLRLLAGFEFPTMTADPLGPDGAPVERCDQALLARFSNFCPVLCQGAGPVSGPKS
jgi:hypothetical protein